MGRVSCCAKRQANADTVAHTDVIDVTIHVDHPSRRLPRAQAQRLQSRPVLPCRRSVLTMSMSAAWDTAGKSLCPAALSFRDFVHHCVTYDGLLQHKLYKTSYSRSADGGYRCFPNTTPWPTFSKPSCPSTTSKPPVVTSKSTASDNCSTRTVCADYINECGQWYGG